MQKLLRKWNEIVADYEANVTNIYGRELFHYAFDVVAHSCLQFRFMGRLVTRGWVQGLLVSDTKCGKTETASKLAKHLGTSAPVDCERASLAGIVGGVDKLGDRFSISWGFLPRHDRRLAVLDELTGLSVDDISAMSSVRSSGIAQITKIQAEQTMARTRILMLANPRSKTAKKMSSYTFGCLTVPEVIGRMEDISRFDFCTGASSDDVPLSVLNAKEIRQVEHKYTGEAAHALLFWAWTRDSSQVTFAAGVEHMVLDAATAMCAKYSPAIPMVEPGEQRYRIARIAVALAARFHSASNDGQRVVVLHDHVDLAVWFLSQCFDAKAFAYDRFSKRTMETQLTQQEFEEMLTKMHDWPNEDAIIEALAHSSDVTKIPVMESHKVPGFLGEMAKRGMLEQTPAGLEKTKKFGAFYRKWKEQKDAGN